MKKLLATVGMVIGFTGALAFGCAMAYGVEHGTTLEVMGNSLGLVAFGNLGWKCLDAATDE